MIKQYWNLIGQEPFLSLTWELDFSQACSFCRMLMNHKNFDFTQIPDKTNDAIFLKKTCFWASFNHFFPMGFFSKKSSYHTQVYIGPEHYAKFQKKMMSQSRENLQPDGRRDRQTLFYRTLLVEARYPTTSLQQVTDENTPNLF